MRFATLVRTCDLIRVLKYSSIRILKYSSIRVVRVSAYSSGKTSEKEVNYYQGVLLHFFFIPLLLELLKKEKKKDFTSMPQRLLGLQLLSINVNPADLTNFCKREIGPTLL